MNVIPANKPEQIAWFEAHAPVFVDNAAAIGITPTQASAFSALATAAAAAFDEAQAARAASKAATIEQDTAMRTCHTLASELVKTIRAYAEQTMNPNVYALAQIPPPADPTPIAPVNPSNVRFDLLNDGTLELKWDGKTSGGTSYLIFRSLLPTPTSQPTPLVQIGNSGERKFIDTTIPACTTSATYIIKALKGTTLTPGSSPATARFAPTPEGQGVALQLAA